MREGGNNQLFLFSIGSVALRISPVVWVRLTGAGFDTLGFFLQEVGWQHQNCGEGPDQRGTGWQAGMCSQECQGFSAWDVPLRNGSGSQNSSEMFLCLSHWWAAHSAALLTCLPSEGKGMRNWFKDQSRRPVWHLVTKWTGTSTFGPGQGSMQGCLSFPLRCPELLGTVLITGCHFLLQLLFSPQVFPFFCLTEVFAGSSVLVSPAMAAGVVRAQLSPCVCWFWGVTCFGSISCPVLNQGPWTLNHQSRFLSDFLIPALRLAWTNYLSVFPSLLSQQLVSISNPVSATEPSREL